MRPGLDIKMSQTITTRSKRKRQEVMINTSKMIRRDVTTRSRPDVFHVCGHIALILSRVWQNTCKLQPLWLPFGKVLPDIFPRACLLPRAVKFCRMGSSGKKYLGREIPYTATSWRLLVVVCRFGFPSITTRSRPSCRRRLRRRSRRATPGSRVRCRRR